MLDQATRSNADLDASKRLVRRFIDEVFVRGRVDAVDALATDDFTTHTSGGPQVGAETLRATMARVVPALDDIQFQIEDMVAEGDRVAVRLTTSARPVKAFMGIPPSGRSYTVEEIHIFRVEDGKVAEHWHQFDQVGLQQQLGQDAAKDGQAS